jgi:hypothetical protein
VNDTKTAITKPEPTITTLKDVLDIAAKLLIGIATLCFGIGLVIVNTWLARYSVHSESFVRTEYVLAGAPTLHCFFLLPPVLNIANQASNTLSEYGRRGVRIRRSG